MTDKTRWLGLGPWHEDNESELIDWTAQPQYKGLVKGDYYHAELRYSGRWGDPGHKGELDVVFDDDGKIAFNPAVELSYLDSYQQRAVPDAMALNDCTPSHAQAIKMRQMSEAKTGGERLAKDALVSIMKEEKPNQKEQFKIPKEKISRFFAPGTPTQKIEDTIVKALELYRKRQRSLER